MDVKNIKELSQLTGFSISTISRVLNGKGELYRISPVTSNKIIKAAAENNYYPNKIARGLRLEKTETIGLIIPDIANPFFATISKTIEILVRRHDYSLILCDSLDDIRSETELLNLLARRNVDGIILAPVGLSSKHIIDFQKRNIPVVVIDRYLPDISIPSITSDNYTGAYEAVNYMISKGHTKIACIQGSRGVSVNTDRVKGYRDAIEQNGISVDDNFIIGDGFGLENGYIQTRILMSRNNPPTAILALSNLISLGILRALNEIGLRVPDDVSVVSFDDQPYSEFLASPMTTVDQMNEKIGEIAVNILFESIKTGKIDNELSIKLKPKLIIRDSVKTLQV